MSENFDTMMDPPIEALLERAGSKFSLVALASQRAREINAYYGNLGGPLGAVVPPQVTSHASKSLSIAFEEIDQKKIVPMDRDEAEAALAAAMESSEGDEAS